MKQGLFEALLRFASVTRILSRQFRRVTALQDCNIVVLLYHDVTEAQFRDQITFLDKEFSFWGIQDLINSLESGRFPSELKVVLTFDDGIQSFYREAFPVVEELEVPVVNYVTVGIIGSGFWRDDQGHYRVAISEIPFKGISEPQHHLTMNLGDAKKRGYRTTPGMTLAELVEVDKHPMVTIGSHTISHPNLLQVSKRRSEQEVRDSKLYLEKMLNHQIKHFAYPFGVFSEREKDTAQQAGYESAAAVDDTWITRDSSIFSFPRKGSGPRGSSVRWLQYRMSR